MTNLVKDLANKLQAGKQSARDLVENCLATIESKSGEGKRAFIEVYHDRARAEANSVDHARKQGWSLPAFAGIPLSIKDLFDESIDFNFLVLFGVFFSFLFSLITIKLFMKYIKNFSLNIFVIYRIILALVLFYIIYF